MRRAALVALAAVVVAGCGTTHPHPHPSPSPTVNRTATAISSAVAAECSRFATVNAQIEADTAGDHTVGELEDTLGTDATTWEHGLTGTHSGAVMRGVPESNNPARQLAVKIDAANLALANLNLEAALGKAGRVPRDWRGVTNALDAVTRACP